MIHLPEKTRISIHSSCRRRVLITSEPSNSAIDVYQHISMTKMPLKIEDSAVCYGIVRRLESRCQRPMNRKILDSFNETRLGQACSYGYTDFRRK